MAGYQRRLDAGNSCQLGVEGGGPAEAKFLQVPSDSKDIPVKGMSQVCQARPFLGEWACPSGALWSCTFGTVRTGFVMSTLLLDLC